MVKILMQRGSSSSGSPPRRCRRRTTAPRVACHVAIEGNRRRLPLPCDCVPRDSVSRNSVSARCRRLSEQDPFGEAFLLHGSYQAFDECVQIRAARRERKALHISGCEHRPERVAELRVPIMQHVSDVGVDIQTLRRSRCAPSVPSNFPLDVG
jgi:hypothetical protein